MKNKDSSFVSIILSRINTIGSKLNMKTFKISSPNCINVLQQTACLVVNSITVDNFAFLLNYTPVGRTSDSLMVPT